MKKRYLFLSLLGLLNIVFVPVFDVWGGLFPSKPEDNFFEVIEEIFTNENAWNRWVVLFTISIFVPCVFMFISSLLNSRNAFLAFSIVGLIAETSIILKYIDQNNPTDYLPSDDCNIAVGVWVALILFILSTIIGLIKTESHVTVNIVNEVTEPIYIQQQPNRFCSKCGSEIEADANFCERCGNKLFNI